MGKGKEQIVPRISKVRREMATGEIASIFDDYAQTTKQPGPCISFMVFAHFPALLKAKWEAMKLHMWEPGELDRRIKEGISLIAAQVLGCEA
jgi:hypothetical protein